MGILTATRTNVKATTLTIKGLAYAASRISPGEEGTAAFRLDKARGEGIYDVVRTHDGLVRCDCPDYECRHAGTASTCKHGRALVEAGLLEAPSPTAGRPAVAPITKKDLKRAAMWGLKLPADAPRADEPPAFLRPEEFDDAPAGREWVATSPRFGVLRDVEPGPRPTRLDRFAPTPEMEMERLGFDLGYAGEEGRAPAGRPFPELVAFYQGWLDGRARIEAEFNEWLDELEATRAAMDEAFGGPEVTWHPAELAEARAFSAHPA